MSVCLLPDNVSRAMGHIRMNYVEKDDAMNLGLLLQDTTSKAAAPSLSIYSDQKMVYGRLF